MTMRIDFHSNVPDKLLYACRLVRKARAQANPERIVLLLPNPMLLAQLDEALWSFSDIDFLPHVQANHALAAQTPVLLTCNEAVDCATPPILINLTRRTLEQPQRYARVFDLVGSDDEDKLAGRERYRFYQQQGFTLSHFVANLQ
ncbi:MAG: DNA polymerase III subunit chi [Burkholderiales bacterium]|nr:DNA polymerase III subunit chi [Burkholderiales bacterium]